MAQPHIPILQEVNDSGFNESNMSLDLSADTSSEVVCRDESSLNGDSLNPSSILSVFDNPFWNDDYSTSYGDHVSEFDDALQILQSPSKRNYRDVDDNACSADIGLPVLKNLSWHYNNSISSDDYESVDYDSSPILEGSSRTFNDDSRSDGYVSVDDGSSHIFKGLFRAHDNGANVVHDMIDLKDAVEAWTLSTMDNDITDESIRFSLASRKILETLKIHVSKATHKQSEESTIRQPTKFILRKMRSMISFNVNK